MKKSRLLLLACGLLFTIISSGQTTLTFRLANPKVVFAGGINYFAFDIQVKAAAPGSYVFSGQAVLSFDNSSLSTSSWSVKNGPLLAGTYVDGLDTNDKYNPPVKAFSGSAPNFKYGVAWTANSGSVGQPASSERFNEITTSFQTLITISAPITDVAGMAGIDFDEAGMNGQQSYKIDAIPWYLSYINPNLYEAADFMNTYLGRIYANSIWSQFGGTVDWTGSVNTSVWDGNAAIPGGSEAKASNLRIHNPATLTLPVNGKMTVSGSTDINTASGLSILSDATGTGSFITGSASGTGSAVAQRYMTGGNVSPGVDRWHLISAPVGGQSITTFVPAASNNIALNPVSSKWGLALYDNSIPAWAHYTAATLPGAGNFAAGKGYEVLRSTDGTLTFTGSVAAGPVDIGVTNPGSGKWWNLIGNPFTSAIFANSNADATNNFLTINDAILESGYKAIYVYNQATTSYNTINTATPAAYVPIGQAFFVRSAASGGTANFSADMRTHNAAAFKSVQSNWPSINLMASIAGENRSTGIYFIPGTTTGLDEGYDAGMFEDNNPEIAVSTHIDGSNIDFAIQSLPDNDYENTAVAVGLNAPQGSAVNFTAVVTGLPSNTRVYLEDRLTGKFTRLDEAGSFYTIGMNTASKGTGRFFIRTSQGAMGVIDEVMGDLTVVALPREHKIRVLGTVTPNSLATIYELNGSVVGTQVLPNVGENEMPFMPVSSGVYLLKVQQTGKTPTSVKINWIY